MKYQSDKYSDFWGWIEQEMRPSDTSHVRIGAWNQFDQCTIFPSGILDSEVLHATSKESLKVAKLKALKP